jgi:hypothetical protein
MDLLSILIKEREIEWPSSVAQCAERFTALGALRSSGFQLALVDLLVQELYRTPVKTSLLSCVKVPSVERS